MENILKQILSEVSGVNKRLDKMECDIVEMKSDIVGLKTDMSEVKSRTQKLEVTQEKISSKLELMAEIQKSHMEANESQHNDIINKLGNEISLVKYAIKNNTSMIESVKYDLSRVEINTAYNWLDIARLKSNTRLCKKMLKHKTHPTT